MKYKIRLNKRKLICIAILNYNGLKITINCIDSLLTKTMYGNYKIILLDNGSIKDDYKVLKNKFGKSVDIIKSTVNLGYTKGINFIWNYAIKKYNPAYICNVNNDIIFIQNNWLMVLVDCLEKKSSYGICAGIPQEPEGRYQLEYISGKKNPEDYIIYNKIKTGIKEVDYIGGSVLLIKRDVINKIGGLDENFFYGMDDRDYCIRAKKSGFRVFCNNNSNYIHIGSYTYIKMNKDFIYKHQSYGEMIYSFRYNKLLKCFQIIIKELVRTIITRKNIMVKWKLNNIYFHKTFLIRVCYFFTSLILALFNYKKIKNTWKLTSEKI